MNKEKTEIIDKPDLEDYIFQEDEYDFLQNDDKPNGKIDNVDKP